MLKVPSETTLKKYGLTAEDWLAIAAEQGNVCFVCEKEPSTGRLNVDHSHEKGWKKKSPEERKLCVRGLLCYFCNLFLVGRGVTVKKSKRVTEYLERYETRRGKNG